jgi:hypothetical protein
MGKRWSVVVVLVAGAAAVCLTLTFPGGRRPRITEANFERIKVGGVPLTWPDSHPAAARPRHQHPGPRPGLVRAAARMPRDNTALLPTWPPLRRDGSFFLFGNRLALG